MRVQTADFTNLNHQTNTMKGDRKTKHDLLTHGFLIYDFKTLKKDGL